MPSINLLRVYLRGWKAILVFTLLGVALAFLFSIIQPLRVSSEVRLLITQTNATGVDPYTAIKSTERIGQNLSELVYSSSFFNAIMSQEGIDRSYFPTDEIDKRKEWRDTVDVAVTPGTGVMTIKVYHKDKVQAAALSVAVAKELAEQAPNYFGYSVRVQIIDDPLPSRFFAKPDFLTNTLMGLVFGFLLGSAYVLARMKHVR
ncbi:hypothetical protein KKG46_02210 [Patescibacteria group bacterium]|nr:hypothetical protein [Patescibacteria group bacterium]